MKKSPDAYQHQVVKIHRIGERKIPYWRSKTSYWRKVEHRIGEIKTLYWRKVKHRICEIKTPYWRRLKHRIGEVKHHIGAK